MPANQRPARHSGTNARGKKGTQLLSLLDALGTFSGARVHTALQTHVYNHYSLAIFKTDHRPLQDHRLPEVFLGPDGSRSWHPHLMSEENFMPLLIFSLESSLLVMILLLGEADGSHCKLKRHLEESHSNGLWLHSGPILLNLPRLLCRRLPRPAIRHPYPGLRILDGHRTRRRLPVDSGGHSLQSERDLLSDPSR